MVVAMRIPSGGYPKYYVLLNDGSKYPLSYDWFMDVVRNRNFIRGTLRNTEGFLNKSTIQKVERIIQHGYPKYIAHIRDGMYYEISVGDYRQLTR